MRKISRDELIELTGSVYKLCNLAALRAMELNSGMRKLVDSEPMEKVTTIAIREIAEKKIQLNILA
ncbi:MAG: DNA-directed RNA polymerase subunit omega [Candidatus Omnitrophota bacterium]